MPPEAPWCGPPFATADPGANWHSCLSVAVLRRRLQSLSTSLDQLAGNFPHRRALLAAQAPDVQIGLLFAPAQCLLQQSLRPLQHFSVGQELRRPLQFLA